MSPLCPLGAAPVWVLPVQGVYRDVRGKRHQGISETSLCLGGATVAMLLRVSKSHLKSPQVSPEATSPVTLQLSPLQTCGRYPRPDLIASQQSHQPCNQPSVSNSVFNAHGCFHPPGWPLADTVLKTDKGPHRCSSVPSSTRGASPALSFTSHTEPSAPNRISLPFSFPWSCLWKAASGLQ